MKQILILMFVLISSVGISQEFTRIFDYTDVWDYDTEEYGRNPKHDLVLRVIFNYADHNGVIKIHSYQPYTLYPEEEMVEGDNGETQSCLFIDSDGKTGYAKYNDKMGLLVVMYEEMRIRYICRDKFDNHDTASNDVY